MYCQYCGTQLHDNAKFCSECGRKVKKIVSVDDVENEGTLCVTRERSNMAMEVSTKLYLDNEYIGSVSNNVSKSFSVPVGEHTLELRTSGNRGTSKTIVVLPNTESFITFKLSASEETLHRIINISDYTLESHTSTKSALAEYSSPSPSSKTAIDERPARVHANDPVKESVRRCPHCGGIMQIQTVVESRKSGCGSCLLYFILFISLLGWLILIPLLLRKKTETVTYAVCQNCGYQKELRRR